MACLSAFLLAAALPAAHTWDNPGRERFVVRLALSSEGADAEAAPQTSHLTAPRAAVTPANQGLEVPSEVGLKIRGFPFSCKLPTRSVAGHESRERAARYVASSRAAAVAGRCFQWTTSDANGVPDESFEVCVGDQFSGTFGIALYEKDADRLLDMGGFAQIYSRASTGGQPAIQVELRCQCSLPDMLPEESVCEPGDEVLARHASGKMLPAVVAGPADDQGKALRVLWGDAEEQLQGIGAVLRSEMETLSGLSCGSVPPPPAEVGRLVSSSTALEETDALRRRLYNLELVSVACCGPQALRMPTGGGAARAQLAFERLLSPLLGRCQRLLSGWWTYEVCWPWRVRLLHLSTMGEVDGPGVTLGRFPGAEFALTPAASRQEGRRREWRAMVEGDACEQTVHKWDVGLQAYQQTMVGVGGSFNPATVSSVEGPLVSDSGNADGCKKYSGHMKLSGGVALVKRGNCWFHTKAMQAQNAGAVAIIVYNEGQHQMVDVMEGVDELRTPLIPTVLVERSSGTRLQHALGQSVTLSKMSVDGMDVNMPMTTAVSFRCSSEWRGRQQTCQAGDQVEVKFIADLPGPPEDRWPKSAVRLLRAVVTDTDYLSGTLEVRWQPKGEGEEDDGEEDPSPVVPLSMTYRDGVACDSDPIAFIELLSEPQACQAEFVLHVASLCAHPALLPQQPRETQVISCEGAGEPRD